MSYPELSITEWLEDFDNSELNSYDWHEQMREAVQTYNEKYDKTLDAEREIHKYKCDKRSFYNDL